MRELTTTFGIVCFSITASLGPVAAAQSVGAVSITVVDLDDISKIVDSVVFALQSNTKTTTRIGETDRNGHVAQAYKCGIGSTLYAEPRDKGVYFNSPEVDCGPTVTLLVPRKVTKWGAATSIDYRRFMMQGPNGVGNTYVWVSRTTIEGAATNVEAHGHAVMTADGHILNSRRCEITVSPHVHIDVFDAKNWAKLAQVEPDITMTTETSTFNKPCNETSVDFGPLKKGAAESAMRSVDAWFSSPVNTVTDPNTAATLTHYRGVEGAISIVPPYVGTNGPVSVPAAGVFTPDVGRPISGRPPRL